MPVKEPTGYIKKTTEGWTARITYTEHGDGTKQRRNRKKTFKSRGDAQDWLDTERKAIKKRVSRKVKAFAQLVAYYCEQIAIPPEWKDDRLVSGMRSWEDERYRANVAAEYLGSRMLSSIRYDDLDRLRLSLHKRPCVKIGKDGERFETERTLSHATVNRMMAVVRRMLNVAVRNEWLDSSPFGKGKPLIRVSDETPRERILTAEEETRLLKACERSAKHGKGSKRKRWAHLRPILIVALDTGMRFGEYIRMTWGDVDFEEGLLTVRSRHTKTLRARFVGMTKRIAEELKKIKPRYAKKDDPVFGIAYNVDKAWRSVRKAAGLEDVRLHDLRHSHASRLIERGVSLTQVGKALGHTQAQTTLRYVNVDRAMAKQTAKKLEEAVN